MRGTGPDGEGAEADLSRRLEKLSRDLDAERREHAGAAEPSRVDARGFAVAVRLASEFVAGVLVGAALGWGIDRLAGTSPWGLIVFLLLGFVAGVVNVIRSAGRTTAPPA